MVKEEVIKDVKHSYENVVSKCLEYFNGDDLASEVWINKYCLKNNAGELFEETPDDMHKRMAKEFFRVEKTYNKALNQDLSKYGLEREPLTEEKIYNYFKNFSYIIPQGSVMSVLGNKFMTGSLSNCIVLREPYDSYGGIMYVDQQLTQLYKRRCGVGVSLSSLRPKDMSVNNAAGTTTGAVSFMERYSNTTREVGQAGRRGALMLTLDIRHPDIMDFITIKQDLKKVTGANVSVWIRDDFMKAVVDNASYTLRFPVEAEVADAKITKVVPARALWDAIVKCAHSSAEPGIIFADRQHNYSTSSVYPNYKNVTTNPCSEIAMGAMDSCRLMVVNYYSFVKNPFTKSATFDYDKLYEVVYEAQRLMDDLVDLELESVEKILDKIESDPEPDYVKQVEKQTWEELYKTGREGRRTGLGFTALADTIAALGFKFDDDKSLEIIDKISRIKMLAEFDSSIDMAIERGKFKDFDTEIENHSEFVSMIKKEFPKLYNRMMKYGRRNISISTVAPTGSVSIMTQTSSGIEPIYQLSYKRRRKINPNDKTTKIDFVDPLGDSWQEYPVFHPKLKTWMEVNNASEEEVKKSPYWKSSAPDIDWIKRVEMQAIVQKYTTHSLSSTINLPSDATLEKVGEIYIEAWKRGLKGITIYRDGSRTGVLISDAEVKLNLDFKDHHAPKRPKFLNANVYRFQNGGEQWIAFVGLLNGRPYEIFTGLASEFEIAKNIEFGELRKTKLDNGTSRYDFIVGRDSEDVMIYKGLSKAFDREYHNYAKFISGVLRHGMPLSYVIDLVDKLSFNNDNINSWKAGILRTLKKFMKDEAISDKKCSSCGQESLVFEEGCLHCTNCGFSKCS